MKTYFINGTMGDVKYFIDDLAEFQIQEIDSDSLNRYIYPGDTINYALDSYYNQRGAKVYKNVDCQPLLPLQEGRNKYLVLSVGVEKRGVPLATIFENGNPICYRLPDEYYE